MVAWHARRMHTFKQLHFGPLRFVLDCAQCIVLNCLGLFEIDKLTSEGKFPSNELSSTFCSYNSEHVNV